MQGPDARSGRSAPGGRGFSAAHESKADQRRMGLSNLGIVGYFVIWLQQHSEHVSLAPPWFKLSHSVLKPVFGVGAVSCCSPVF